MKISYNWLKQFIKIDWKSDETAALLTDLGLEVETVDTFQTIKGGLEGIIVGKVLTCVQHPNADKLKVTTVDLGNGVPLQIVCGAANVAAGQKVLVATIGTTLYDQEGKPFVIKKGKIRGEESHGMICAEDELGLGSSHEGIMVLDNSIAEGEKASTVFDVETDDIFEIGLTPNRADAMSHLGVARDLRAGFLQTGLNLELITPPVSDFRVDKRTLKIDVFVENSDLIPRYCGVTISGITIKESPTWLQNKLKAIGIQPKNNVVDVTNYVLHELGQPLHAFDAARISGKINVKNAIAGTQFITLDGVQRTLHEEDIIVCDDKEPLCLGGVLGGLKSGISEKTNAIFLESAYFNPVSIRKTAKRHQINTDASFRFERGIDPEITEYALKRAALLIQEVAGGEITSDILDLYPKKIEDFTIFLNFENVNRIIGQQLSKDIIKQILASLEIKITSISDVGLGLIVPSYRVDVQREIDVVEEILRVYGYNNISFSKKINATVFNTPKNEDYKIQNIVAAQLNALGFHEMMSNSLTTANYVALSEDFKKENNVTMINPLSNDLATMRQSLLFSGLEAVAYNINRKNADLKLFEFGKTYYNFENKYQEFKHLALFQTGYNNAESWKNTQEISDFFIFKGFITSLFYRLGINFKEQPTNKTIFSEGLTFVDKDVVLINFGVVKKSILKYFGIKQTVFYADFEWDSILKLITGKIKFVDIPKYPEVRRDLSLLLDENVSYKNIYELVCKTEKSTLKAINLFDVYQGENLPKGKKSYTLSFIIQDNSKTLTDVQIDKTMLKIQQQLESELGAVLR